MTVNQIYTLVNDIAKQSLGIEPISQLDATGVISLGNQVLSSSTNTSAFCNTLLDRIAKTIISVRPYPENVKNILMDNISYGAIIQKIYVEPMNATKNDSWELEDGTEVNNFVISKPKAKQKLFETRNTWSYEVTIPDYQLNTAFTSESALASFISGVYTAMETSISVSLENMTNLCIANFIGSKLLYSEDETTKGIHAINLLEKYNTTFSKTLKANSCLTDLDFLKYAGREIKLHINRMARLSEIYNMESYKRHTPKEDMHIMFLIDYASANATYLESDTFHNELVSLPNYTEISYWQGQGESGAFDDVSKISLTLSNGTDTVDQSGIIGFIFDRDALGVMVNRRNSQATYSPRYELTQRFEKADMGYFNDLSENALVFYVSD